MLIKDEFRIKEGQTIKWRMKVPVLDSEDAIISTYKEQDVELVCIKNYDHHSDFRMLIYPYFTINIMNAVLYQLGTYKPEHSVVPFARY